jgi:hypothetical protein
MIDMILRPKFWTFSIIMKLKPFKIPYSKFGISGILIQYEKS